jgi:hypothetical protein
MGKPGNQNVGYEGNKGPRENFSKKGIKCYNCGLLGHMAKDCRKPKSVKVDRANKTVAGQIAYYVRDKEITEREWKECARESLMHEDGWGDVESESKDESEDEDDEEELESSEGLEGFGGHVPLETELLCLSCCQLPSSSLMELHGIEGVPLLDVAPLEVSAIPTITNNLQERQIARRESLVVPASAVSFWECVTKTKAELELIESSSDQESETEWDLPMGPTGLGLLATRELARLEEVRGRGVRVLGAGLLLKDGNGYLLHAPEWPAGVPFPTEPEDKGLLIGETVWPFKPDDEGTTDDEKMSA